MAKRIFDIIFSFVGILLLSPLFLIIGIAIKLTSKGPVFFLQERIGYKGKPFRIWKFRTMIENAERNGLSITVNQDPRVTRFGWFLRRYKLDELPQLINVFVGEMTFVGPRPEVQKYVDQYSKDQLEVLSLKPGITDPASIKYRDEGKILAAACDPEEEYRRKIVPDKIDINLRYANRANLITDIKVILRTILG